MKDFQSTGEIYQNRKIFYLAVSALLFESQSCDFYVVESGLYVVSKADICLF
jgi:hypothetical protein